MDRKTREKLLRESERKTPEELAAEALRRAARLTEEDDITTTILAYGGENPPQEEIIYKYSKDISVSGTKIQGNVLLPIDTLLKIDLTLRNLHETITISGVVKWNKTIIEHEIYEAGVEFMDTPDETIKKISDYILWKKEFLKLNPVGMPFWIFAKFNKPKS